MASRSPLGSPRLVGRLWPGHKKASERRKPIFVPCPVVPSLKIDNNDIVNNNANDIKDGTKSEEIYLQRERSNHISSIPDFPEPPTHLLDIIRSSEEDLAAERYSPPPPPDVIVSAIPAARQSDTPSPLPPPPPEPPMIIISSDQKTATPQPPPPPDDVMKNTTGKTSSSILPKDIKKGGTFKFPSSKKPKPTGKGFSTAKSVLPKPLSEKEMNNLEDSSSINVTVPVDCHDNEHKLPKSIPKPLVAPDSVFIPGDFPPPPPGVADDVPVSPSYIIPRKPPRPNSGLTKTQDQDPVKNDDAEKLETKVQIGKKTANQKELDDSRISVALNNSLEDLLSHLNNSLPDILEVPKGTPPETRTPTNSLESSQEYLDSHVGLLHHSTPGRDVTTITEEDMATKLDDIETTTRGSLSFEKKHVKSSVIRKEQVDFKNKYSGGARTGTDEVTTKSGHVTTKNDGITTKVDDISTKIDDVTAKTDDVTAKTNDVDSGKPIFDDDLAALLGLDEFDDCLNQIEEEIYAGKGSNATGQELPSEVSYPQSEPVSYPQSEPEDVNISDSGDSEDYDFPIGDKTTFSGPLPPADMDDDEPHYENKEFVRACLQGRIDSLRQEETTQRPESPILPPYPSSDDVEDVTSILQFYPPPPGNSVEKVPQVVESDVYDIPQERDDVFLPPPPDDSHQKPSSSDSDVYDVPQEINNKFLPPPPEVSAEDLEDEGQTYDNPQDLTEDLYRGVNKKKNSTKKKLAKQTSSKSRNSTKVAALGNKISKMKAKEVSQVCDRPPPPTDAPPKSERKGKKPKPITKPGKAPPLPPKDADLLVTKNQMVEEVEEDPYSSIEDLLGKAAKEEFVEVLGDDDWNSDDEEIYADFEDWD